MEQSQKGLLFQEYTFYFCENCNTCSHASFDNCQTTWMIFQYLTLKYLKKEKEIYPKTNQRTDMPLWKSIVQCAEKLNL